MREVLFLALLIVASTAVAKPPAPPPKQPPPAPKSPAPARSPAPAGVRAVDWRNFTYPGTGCERCQGSGPIKIVRGRSAPDPIFVDLDAYLVRVTYFDATGSEEDEALVEVFWRHSPKGYNRRWYLFGHGGRLELIWQGFSLSYEDELSGVLKATPGKRGFTTEEVDAAGKRTLVTYAGSIEGKVRVTRKTRVGNR